MEIRCWDSLQRKVAICASVKVWSKPSFRSLARAVWVSQGCSSPERCQQPGSSALQGPSPHPYLCPHMYPQEVLRQVWVRVQMRCGFLKTKLRLRSNGTIPWISFPSKKGWNPCPVWSPEWWWDSKEVKKRKCFEESHKKRCGVNRYP